MTQEEIILASKDYINYLLDKQEYHNENYTEDDIRQAFEKGAEWADSRPVNIWHDIDDIPKSNSWILMQNNEEGYNTLRIVANDYSIWAKACRIFSIYKWTYLSGLLPKTK